jgi:hypothetical protein
MRSVDAVGPAVQRLLAAELGRRDAADGQLSTLKAQLANIEWRCECLRDDLIQLDRLINPPPIEGGRLVEIVRRAPPPGQPESVEIITFPAGHTTADAA